MHKKLLGKRTIATAVDYLLVLSVTYCYILYFGEQRGDATVVTGIKTLPIFLLWFVYFVVIETLIGGTLMHKGLGLKIVNLHFGKVTFIQSFKRHLIDIIDFFFLGIVAYIAISNSDKHQRIGDMWAKTIVVDDTPN